MSHKVILTQAEKFLAKTMAHDDALAIGDTSYREDGSRPGAILAVAKLFNVFPNLSGLGCSFYTRLKTRVDVVWAREKQAVYRIHVLDLKGNVLVVVTGGETPSNASYDIWGYIPSAQLAPAGAVSPMQASELAFDIYHHALSPIDDSLTFPEVYRNEF